MAAPDLTPGGSFGHFRIIEKIGAGGFGIVYRARDERLGRDVAIKVLNARTLSDGSAGRQFQREALILSQLDHPNVQSVFEFNSENGVDYLVLGYISGTSLDELVKKGPLPEKEVLSLGIQLMRGLAAAHAKGVLHRDLKPGNLRVTPENVLKILDFGLAQRFASPEATTLEEGMTITLDAPGTVAGTPAYMAPEQLDGHPEHRSDIYSVGVVLYEMATGTRPFPQREQQLLSDAVRYSTPPAPRSKNKEISPALEAIILKCLNKDPNLRYQSASELLDDLKELARGSSSHRGITDVPSPRPHRWFVVGVVLIAVLTVGILNRNKVLKWFGVLPPEPSIKHVAVLPFHMTGAQQQEAVLFEGLTDTVTNRLMQLTAAQAVEIIPFSEINANHVTNMQEARSKLGANLALDGNLQSNGNQLQINLALSDIQSHKQLRADTITGTTTDFKHVEEQVVDAAVRMLELELHKNPPKDEAHDTTSTQAYEAFTRGRGYLSRSSTPENVDSAVAQFMRALELDPGYAAAYASLGRAYWGKYQLTKDQQWIPKMRDACEHSLKLAPSSAEGNICIGMVDFGAGRYEQAASEFQLAIDTDPTNAVAYRKLASAYENLGRREQAEKTYQKAIQAHPEDPSSHAELGTLYDNEAQYQQAAAEFEKAVNLAPDVAEYRSRLGGTYLFAGVYPKAEYALRKAIDLQPSYQAYSNLGQTYFLERKFEDAIAAFEQATVLGEHQIQAHGNLARAYYWYPPTRSKAKAECRKAIELSDAALNVNANNADVHTLVAEYFAMLGEKDEALQHLQRALELRPGDAETDYYAAKVYNLLGNRDQALNWLEKSIKSGYSAAEIENTVELDSLRREPRFQELLQKLRP